MRYNRPLFTLHQQVEFFVHRHLYGQPCLAACARTGRVQMVTYWRRGNEYAYRVKCASTSRQYWVREKHLKAAWVAREQAQTTTFARTKAAAHV